MKQILRVCSYVAILNVLYSKRPIMANNLFPTAPPNPVVIHRGAPPHRSQKHKHLSKPLLPRWGIAALIIFLVVVTIAAAVFVVSRVVNNESAKRALNNISMECDCPNGTICNAQRLATVHAPLCVQCNSSTDCHAGYICKSNSCVKACSNDSQCPDTAGFCHNGGCVKCRVTADCDSDSHSAVCVRGTCLECIVSSECPHGQYCNVATNTCAAGCGNGGACAAGTVCDTTTMQCIQCLSNTNCTGDTPVCDTDTHTCVACIVDSDCPTGTHCNMHNNACESTVCTKLETGTVPTMRLRQYGTLAVTSSATMAGTSPSLGSCLTVRPCSSAANAPTDALCAWWVACAEDGNDDGQWWVKEVYDSVPVLATTRASLGGEADVEYVHGYLIGGQLSNASVRVAQQVGSSSGGTPLQLTPSASTDAFYITSAEPTGSMLYLSTSTGEAIWTNNVNDAAPIVAEFVNPAFTACTKWKFVT